MGGKRPEVATWRLSYQERGGRVVRTSLARARLHSMRIPTDSNWRASWNGGLCGQRQGSKSANPADRSALNNSRTTGVSVNSPTKENRNVVTKLPRAGSTKRAHVIGHAHLHGITTIADLTGADFGTAASVDGDKAENVRPQCAGTRWGNRAPPKYP